MPAYKFFDVFPKCALLYRVEHLVHWVDFDFGCSSGPLCGSAWADEKFGEWAHQLGKMSRTTTIKIYQTQVRDLLCNHVFCSQKKGYIIKSGTHATLTLVESRLRSRPCGTACTTTTAVATITTTDHLRRPHRPTSSSRRRTPQTHASTTTAPATRGQCPSNNS